MPGNYIFDATPENFKELVIGNSMRGPVAVNYWSSTAGPCIKLWPTLEKLANEFNGQFLLINVNTDKFRSFVQNELGVRSVPTIQVFFNQQVVDVMNGAESEQSIRTMLTRHLPRSSDSLLVESVKLYNDNRVDEAIDELRRIQKLDPENPRVATSIVKLLFREERFEEMNDYIRLQSSVVRNNEEIISLQTHAKLQLAASSVEDIEQLYEALKRDENNVELKYKVAAVDAMNDRLHSALEILLEILELDASYQNHLPGKTMVLLLNALGDQAEDVKRYRNRMMDVLSRG